MKTTKDMQNRAITHKETRENPYVWPAHPIYWPIKRVKESLAVPDLFTEEDEARVQERAKKEETKK